MSAESQTVKPPQPTHSGPAPKQPAFVLISQVYVPDPAAVGQYMADAAAEMARRGYRVIVYTARNGYEDPSQEYPAREVRDGVEIRRLPYSSFGKDSIKQRLLAQIIFLLQAMWHSFFTPRLAGMLVSTSPPACGIGGAVVSLLRGVPVKFWVMDLNPDQLVIMKVLPPKAWPVRLFDLFNLAILWRASDVIVLDRFMAQRVAAKAKVAHKLHVLPPWPMEDCHPNLPHARNAFRQQNVPDEANKFVVMYAGNHTPANPLDTLLAAALRLQHHPRLLVFSVGGGAAKKDVDELVAQGVRNIISMPYQPLQQLHPLLSTADVHVVAMGNDMVGVVHPCKVYGAMAVHRPLLLLGPAGCHIGDLIKQHRIGWRVEHGDVQGAERVLKEILDTPAAELQAMGERAAQAIALSLSKDRLMQQLCDVLQRAVRLPAATAIR